MVANTNSKLPALLNNVGVSRLNKQLDSSTWTSTTARLSPSWTASTTDVAAPDVRGIQAIHRGEDGYVSFHRMDDTASDSGWVDVGATRVGDVASVFPSVSPHVGQNSYFSINSTYRAGFWTNKSTGLPHSLRGTDYLRWLNASYVDLDFHKNDGSYFYQVCAGVLRATDDGLIPPASLICRSG